MQTTVTMNTLPRCRIHEPNDRGRSGFNNWRFLSRQLASTSQRMTATTPSTIAGRSRAGERSTGRAEATA